ncbi:MAG: winged helix-turn-helix domain-containing protein [Pseudomonadota bacterium]
MTSPDRATAADAPSPQTVGLVAQGDGFVYLQGQPLRLPPKEGAVLHLLLREWPRVVSKDTFAQQVWLGHSMSDESLARCVAQLRQCVPLQPLLAIQSVYGRGYRLELLASAAPPVAAPALAGHSRLLQDAMAAPRHVEVLMHARQLIPQRTPLALQRAQALLRDLLEQAPDYLGAKLAYAECLTATMSSGLGVDRARLADALTHLQQVQQLAPQAPGLLAEMAHLLDCTWHFAAAADMHAQAAQTSALDASAHYYLGWHLLATGQATQAVAALRQAQQLNPFSVNVAILLARALTFVGEPNAALEQARQAHTAAPESVQASVYFLASQAYLCPTSELLTQARAVLLGPATWTYAASSLAFVLARCGAADEALQLVHTADAHTPNMRANFISTLLLLGQPDQAMQRAWDAVHEGCGPLPTLLRAPENRALRRHADFEHLVRMIPGWVG